VLKTFYLRLLDKGKAKKVDLQIGTALAGGFLSPLTFIPPFLA
jgi:hypothetical protein